MDLMYKTYFTVEMVLVPRHLWFLFILFEVFHRQPFSPVADNNTVSLCCCPASPGTCQKRMSRTRGTRSSSWSAAWGGCWGKARCTSTRVFRQSATTPRRQVPGTQTSYQHYSIPYRLLDSAGTNNTIHRPSPLPHWYTVVGMLS